MPLFTFFCVIPIDLSLTHFQGAGGQNGGQNSTTRGLPVDDTVVSIIVPSPHLAESRDASSTSAEILHGQKRDTDAAGAGKSYS